MTYNQILCGKFLSSLIFKYILKNVLTVNVQTHNYH